jgi:LysM repeat protein
MQVNNLLSNAIAPGQVLKLPIKKQKSNQDTSSNKNHVDINEVTADGFKPLGQ